MIKEEQEQKDDEEERLKTVIEQIMMNKKTGSFSSEWMKKFNSRICKQWKQFRGFMF